MPASPWPLLYGPVPASAQVVCFALFFAQRRHRVVGYLRLAIKLAHPRGKLVGVEIESFALVHARGLAGEPAQQ